MGTSVWSWFHGAAQAVGYVLVVAVLAALVAVLLALVLLHVQSRTKLRDWWPARSVRRPTLEIKGFDDGALATRMGPAVAGLVRGQVTWKRDRFGVNLISGQAGVATALSGLGGVSGEVKAAVAVIDLLTALLPRRRFVVSGELQPAGAQGVGISLEFGQAGGYEALVTFWACAFGLAKEEDSAQAYQDLAVAAAAWVDISMTKAVGGDELLTGDPQSWALFRSGVDRQRLGDSYRARALYEQALAKDGANSGARANLGILLRREQHYRDAEQCLERALDEVSRLPKLPPERNPDWYRISYQLAALCLNWASASPSGPRKDERARRAATMARDLAQTTLETLAAKPPAKWAAFSDETLKPFLAGTIEPSLLVLVASTALPPTPAPRERSQTQLDTVGLRDALAEDPIDPWKLIGHVEAGRNRPAAVLFNLACFYARAGDLGLAGRRLVLAVRETPQPERKALAKVARRDPALAPLRSRRPGILPKLEQLADPADGDAQAITLFERQDRAWDDLVSDGWMVEWPEPTAGFGLCASKDAEVLLVAFLDGDALSDAVRTTIGARTVLERRYPQHATVRARIVVAAGTDTSSVDPATADGVELQEDVPD